MKKSTIVREVYRGNLFGEEGITIADTDGELDKFYPLPHPPSRTTRVLRYARDQHRVFQLYRHAAKQRRQGHFQTMKGACP